MAYMHKRNGRWHVEVRKKGFPDIYKSFLDKGSASKFSRGVESQMERNVFRVLSTKISINGSEIYFHTTHIPPGSQNGWVKIETLEGIYKRLIETKNKLNILCGDFNAPKEESLSKGMITFAQRINATGEVKIKSSFRGGDGARLVN